MPKIVDNRIGAVGVVNPGRLSIRIPYATLSKAGGDRFVVDLSDPGVVRLRPDPDGWLAETRRGAFAYLRVRAIAGIKAKGNVFPWVEDGAICFVPPAVFSVKLMSASRTEAMLKVAANGSLAHSRAALKRKVEEANRPKPGKRACIGRICQDEGVRYFVPKSRYQFQCDRCKSYADTMP